MTTDEFRTGAARPLPPARYRIAWIMVVKVPRKAPPGNPRSPHFVIGVGKELHALDEIARAGSSTDAFLVDTLGEYEGGFLRRYRYPPPGAGLASTSFLLPRRRVIDLQKVNVIFSYQGKTRSSTRSTARTTARFLPRTPGTTTIRFPP